MTPEEQKNELQIIRNEIAQAMSYLKQDADNAENLTDDFNELCFEDGVRMTIDMIPPHLDELADILAQLDTLITDVIREPVPPEEGQLPLWDNLG